MCWCVTTLILDYSDWSVAEQSGGQLVEGHTEKKTRLHFFLILEKVYFRKRHRIWLILDARQVVRSHVKRYLKTSKLALLEKTNIFENFLNTGSFEKRLTGVEALKREYPG